MAPNSPLLILLSFLVSGLCSTLDQFPVIAPQISSEDQAFPFQGPHYRRFDVLDYITDKFVERTLQEWNTPGGAAVAVVRKDYQGNWRVEKKGYGFADIDGKRITPDTLFGIASNSKLFTSISVGMLISNETLSPRLSWTSEMKDLIPKWRLQDSVASDSATILDALSHRTGMPRDDLLWRRFDSEETVVEALHHLRPSAGFRETWQYNNNMYSLLSWLPELVLPDRTPYRDYVQQHILGPLGMSATTFSQTKARSGGNMAQGFAREGVNVTENVLGPGKTRVLPPLLNDDEPVTKFVAGAGGLISSVSDLATWVHTLLLEGRHPITNESVIPAEVIRKVATGYTVMSGKAAFPEFSPTVYGGGQIRGAYRGYELIEHGGSFPGFYTQVSRLPNDDLAVVVLTNDDTHGRYLMEVIKYGILDHALSLPTVNWTERYSNVIKEAVQKIPPRKSGPRNLPISLEKLTGHYHNEAYGTVQLCSTSYHWTDSAACQVLASELPILLPGKVDPDVPSLVTAFNRLLTSHIIFEHDEDFKFRLKLYMSVPTGNGSEPFWAYGGEQDIIYTTAEFLVDQDKSDNVVGFGLVGFWGAGPGVESPSGEDARERAEVWFEKV